jgi:uncharacterized protein (TIGR02421 family)
MAIAPRLETLLRDVSTQIAEAKRAVRVIPSLAWSEEVEREFFMHGAERLPNPTYGVSAKLNEAHAKLQELARQLAGDNEVERFLRETCVAMATAARMLLSVGGRDFYHHSVELYGRPGSLSSDKRTTNLDLARHFEQVIDGYAPPLSDDDVPNLDAEQAAELLRGRLSAYFGQHPIKVRVVDHLAAAASSTSAEIRLKCDVRFSRRDLLQIEYHEGHVHVATTLNGRAQPVVPFIGSLSPRASRSQEGLAVFTEFITGAASLPRVRRLCDRTLAIHMAEQGANFIEVFRFFRDRGNDNHTSFDNARRVMRGGPMEGGAPFTKDGCYLDGLLRVTNFLRIALTKGQGRLVRMLFVGKLAVDDAPLFDRLAREGLVIEPIYLPGWARDLSFLTAFMSYTAFLGRSDLTVEEHRFTDCVARAEADLT